MSTEKRFLRRCEKTSLRDGTDYMFWCPACKCGHKINDKTWAIRNPEKDPTVMPSVLVTTEDDTGKRICHLFIQCGQIIYLSDCTHEFAGRTVVMEKF